MKNLVVGHLIACFYIYIYTALDIWQSSSVPRPLPDPVFVFFSGHTLNGEPRDREERTRIGNVLYFCHQVEFYFWLSAKCTKCISSKGFLEIGLRKIDKIFNIYGLGKDILVPVLF